MHILRLPVHNWLYKGIQQQWKWCSFFCYCSLRRSDKIVHNISNSGVGQRKLPIGLLWIWKHFPPWSPNKTYVIREQSYIEMQFNQPKNVISHLKYHMIDTFPCCSHLQRKKKIEKCFKQGTGRKGVYRRHSQRNGGARGNNTPWLPSPCPARADSTVLVKSQVTWLGLEF